jgi:cytochrome oxidase Cu insertion factor (SCO1/SenC/PrrC family)
MARAAISLAASLLLLLAAPPSRGHGGPHAEAADEGAPPLAYELPAAGSYELPPILRVADHELLDSDGARARILDLAPGEVCFVSLVYLACHDAGGCPLALATLLRLDRALAAHPELARRVRLATVSFDPARDRPADLARLREGLAPRSRWRFLTASGEAELAPVLEDFGQDKDLLPAAAGEPERLGHVLKVFLVDSRGDVRNVYSTGFLDHRLLLRDAETLLLPP